MHRGTVFIITKDKNNKFEIQKSTEFNGGMGLDCYGKAIYDMLRSFKEPLLFDTMIRDFDERYFKYGDDVMTYSPDEQHNPYIDKNGNEHFEYAQIENQFKFFKDDNGEYIYTSDSNYIKNMSDEVITVVCSNGNYVLKPNQILIADYNECINNTRITFGEKIDKKIDIDELNTKEYIPTRKQEIILDNIIKTIETFNYKVNLIYENGMISGMKIETLTNGGVDMIHTFYFCDDYQELYDKDNVKKQLQDISDNFSIDDEIDMHRQEKNYKSNFSISQSLEDFTEYQKRLEDLAKNFITKYHELIYQKSINNELENKPISIMNSQIYFKTKSLGNLKILALIDNYALIEKMHDAPEKYIIVSGFDIKNKSWNSGSYYNNFKEALEDFKDRVLCNRNIQLDRNIDNEDDDENEIY